MTGGGRAPRTPPRRDEGETLIEVVVAMVLLAGAGAMVMGGLLTVARNEHVRRDRSPAQALLVSAAEAIVATECATGPGPDEAALTTISIPASYAVTILKRETWNPPVFEAQPLSCARAQRITLEVTGPGPGDVVTTVLIRRP